MSTADPIEPSGRFDRQPGGKLGWLILALGAVCLLLNHALAVIDDEVNLWLLFFGPLLTVFGLATLYDRRILIGASKEASTVPARFRVVAATLALLSLSITVLLALAVY